MPVEIRELVIKTTVTDAAAPPAAQPMDRPEALREIVAACVEEVLDKLERQSER